MVTAAKDTGKITKTWLTKTRKRAKELVVERETNYMRLAQVLYEIYAYPVGGDENPRPVFREWGHSSFHDYVQDELGIHPKKADRLKATWFHLEVRLDLSPELRDRIVALGSSKVRELVRILTDENAEEWVEHAEHCSYREVLRMVNQYIDDLKDAEDEAADGEDPESPTIQLPEEPLSETFQLFPEQARNVDLAVRRAKMVSGSSKRGHNLDLICTAFLGSNDFGPNKNKNRAKLLADLEKSLDVKIVALKPKSLEILYGAKILEALADS